MSMGEYWDRFIFGFCKVEFLCWQGEPNWLGFMVLALAVPVTLISGLFMVGGLLTDVRGGKFIGGMVFVYFSSLLMIIAAHSM
jgi:hypothetical protein